MRALALLIIALLAIAAIAASEHQRLNDGLPITNADYPMCVTVRPGPIVKPGRPDARRQPSELV